MFVRTVGGQVPNERLVSVTDRTQKFFYLSNELNN